VFAEMLLRWGLQK